MNYYHYIFNLGGAAGSAYIYLKIGVFHKEIQFSEVNTNGMIGNLTVNVSI
ncbi:hypothetical protein [Sphingobacterium sp.]|uniref:hypothetical protein n=1 Tax=Sphingobacterium sp. TaxID=341027 RepID=UPI0028AC85F3|nr:hypothetical protein [Sphingobacterium sp.]